MTPDTRPEIVPSPRAEAVFRRVAERRETIERISTEIATLSAHLHAATYHLLSLIAEFDEHGGWSDEGCMSCVHWLNWRCGYDSRTAREKMRVAHALTRFPAIAEAFREGRISYSKVRAMTRVANERNEADLLYFAIHGTAAHVEIYVRACREMLAGQPDPHDVRRRHAERSVRWYYHDDGSLVINAKLPPEAGARVLAALDAALDGLESEERGETQPLLVPLPAKLAQAEARAAAGDPEPVSWYPLPRPLGPEEPPLCPLDPAEEPRAARRADALGRLADAYFGLDPSTSPDADRYQVVVHVDAEALANSEPDSEARAALARGVGLPPETVRRIACEGAVIGVLEDTDGNPLHVGRRARRPSRRLRLALEGRDQTCRFPGCAARHHLHVHHVHHWAEGGETSLGNLALLCGFHHRLVHEGSFGLSVLDDGALRFTRPDGRPLAGGGSAEPPPADPLGAEALATSWRNTERHSRTSSSVPIP